MPNFGPSDDVIKKMKKGIARIGGKPKGVGPGTDNSQSGESLFQKFMRRKKKDIQLPKR